MSVIRNCDEYAAFTDANEELKKLSYSWPHNDDNELTMFLTEVRAALRKLSHSNTKLREFVDKIGGDEEYMKCITDFSNGLRGLGSQIAMCLSAFRMTFDRLHGRDPANWEEIEGIWPECSDNKRNGVFAFTAQRVTYNDYLHGWERQNFDVVVSETASAEMCLSILIAKCKTSNDKFKESGVTLPDPSRTPTSFEEPDGNFI